tara:strand:- start:2570 stop:2722 length:153 start_codon:yes stop_codon:yes gene_type:complete
MKEKDKKSRKKVLAREKDERTVSDTIDLVNVFSYNFFGLCFLMFFWFFFF